MAVALAGVREPVVAILLLIAFFSTISGKPLDGVLLLLAAVGLAVDASARARAEVRRAAGVAQGSPVARVDAECEGAGTEGGAIPGPGTGAVRPAVLVFWLALAALYAAVVGSFARYSWPATLAVTAVGVAAVAIGWRGPLIHRPAPWPLPRRGMALWGALLAAGGLWELGALLLQPDITADSDAHPTISTLTDPLLASHGGRSAVLGIWLGLGWYLVRR